MYGLDIEVKGFVGTTSKNTSVANVFPTVSIFSDTCGFVVDRICRRNVSLRCSYVDDILSFIHMYKNCTRMSRRKISTVLIDSTFVVLHISPSYAYAGSMKKLDNQLLLHAKSR